MPNIKLPANDLYLGTVEIASSTGTLYQEGVAITASAAELNALSATFDSAVLTTPQINDTTEDHQYVVAVSELTADRTVTLPLLTGNDEFVFKDHTQTLTNKTLTSPTINTATLASAKIATGGSINDAGGDEYIKFVEGTTPVNYVQITSANASASPKIQGAGETNTPLMLSGSGTGNVQIADGTDVTKIIDFELVGATAGTKTTITASQTADRVITLPDSTCTLLTTAGTDTLTNKTLTTPIIASFYQDAGKTQLMTAPNTASDTLVAVAATQTLTNKTLTSPALTSPVITTPQINDTSADHQYVFAVSELAADRTVTLPLLTGADEFVFKDHTQTLTNKTLTTPKIATTGAIVDAGGDEYLKFVEATTPITYVQITSGDTTVKPIVQGAGETNIGLQLMGSGTGNVTIVDATTPSKALDFELVGATASTMTTITASQTDNRVLTLPDATDTLVGKATADVLTNKVLTLPQINDTTADHQYVFAVSELTADRTITLPLLTGADEFVFKDHAQTLTNKTLTAPVVSSLVLSDGDENLDITVTNQTDSGATITIPDIVDSADTMVLADLAQTLTNKTTDAASNPFKNVVLAYAANITRAEMITGKALVAAEAGRTIRVLSVKMLVTGAFNGGAGTSFVLQDSSATVVVLTALKAALTDGAKISTEGLAIANVTEGAGMVGNLTAANGISVAADAAWDAGTGIDLVILYKYV